MEYYFQIRDSKNGILSKKEAMSQHSKAPFTIEFADTYELCIISHVNHGNVYIIHRYNNRD